MKKEPNQIWAYQGNLVVLVEQNIYLWIVKLVMGSQKPFLVKPESLSILTISDMKMFMEDIQDPCFRNEDRILELQN